MTFFVLHFSKIPDRVGGVACFVVCLAKVVHLLNKLAGTRVSEPSVQNLKEIPIMKTFAVVTIVKHQATINR